MKKLLKRITKNSIILICLALAMTGCAVTSYKPVAVPGVAIESGFAVLRTDSLLVAVRPQAWQGEPSSLNSFFFCAFIQVRNHSNRTVVISPQDIVLIANNNQYDIIPSQNIISSYQYNPFLEQFNQPFSADRVKYNPENQQQIMYSIIQNSFSFGTLIPGATKRGYIFFNREAFQARTLQFILYNREITFAK